MVSPAEPVTAAGGVLRRLGRGNEEIALVHRRRYDEWALPKGKVEEGETALEAALREVAEETGYRARAERFLGTSSYDLPDGKPKVVHFWLMTPASDGAFVPSEEIDEVAWLSRSDALERLVHAEERRIVKAIDEAL